MPRLVIPEYIVLRDTAEKSNHGWVFDKSHSNKKPPKCIGTEDSNLDTGDYTIKGYEDIFVIERKNDLSELWVNYGEPRDEDGLNRFEREMKRMLAIKYRFIIVETLLTHDSFSLSPPQFSTAAPGKALLEWIFRIMIDYQTPVLFVGQCGKRVAQHLMDIVIRKEKDRWIPQTPQI